MLVKKLTGGRGIMFNGQLIKHLRRVKHMSQQDIADMLGVTRGTVSNWEIGRRTPDLITFIKLAELLGVSMDLFVIQTPQQAITEICAQVDAFYDDREIDDRDKLRLTVALEKRLRKQEKK